MGPSDLSPTHLEVDMVILTFSFDPSHEPIPQNLHRGETSGPPESVPGTTRASTGRWVTEQWNVI